MSYKSSIFKTLFRLRGMAGAFVLSATLLLGTPALAQTATPAAGATPAKVWPTPTGYAPLWVDKSAVVTQESIDAVIAGLRKQEADPQQIVVFIHGFDVPRENSTEEFEALATRVTTEFAKSKTRFALAGLQWESAVDANVFTFDAAYFAKIPVARSVGRGPARQMLLAIAQEFPNAQLSLMAHSMGCEVAAAAVVPEIHYAENPPFVETFEPEQDVKVLMAVMCGSDLDANIWATSGVKMRANDERCRLMWSTISPYLKEGDEVLAVRDRIRGRAAGAAFPKMTLPQLDDTMSHQRLILDNTNIPSDHAFEKYYDQARINHVIPAMLYLTDPKTVAQPVEFSDLDLIFAQPAQATALTPFLDSPNYSSLFYALWRLEQVNCGDARHLTDGTLEKIARLLRGQPQKIWREAPKSPCITVQKLEFPTAKMMTTEGAPPSSNPFRKRN